MSIFKFLCLCLCLLSASKIEAEYIDINEWYVRSGEDFSQNKFDCYVFGIWYMPFKDEVADEYYFADVRNKIDRDMKTHHKLFVVTSQKNFCYQLIRAYGDRVICCIMDPLERTRGPSPQQKRKIEWCSDVLYRTDRIILVNTRAN